MKKLVFLSVLLTAMPFGMMAQDDLYFTPKKSDTKSEVRSANPQYDKCPTYYCGSNRDVDEYNRRGRVSSYYQKIGTDSLGNDIIQFHAGNGQYPDSLVLDTIYPGSEQYYAYDGGDSDDSFAYSRRLNRFDNAYGWYDPWFYDDLTWDYPYYGYGPYWRYGWGWGNPWYCGYYGWEAGMTHGTMDITAGAAHGMAGVTTGVPDMHGRRHRQPTERTAVWLGLIRWRTALR